MNVRPDDAALLPRGGRAEAGRVEILARFQIVARIAGQNGLQSGGVGAQNGRIAEIIRPLDVQGATGIRLNGRAAG